MARRRRGSGDDHPLARELADIKRLLILLLLAEGFQAKDIAKTLGVAKSTLSEMVPARSIKRRA